YGPEYQNDESDNGGSSANRIAIIIAMPALLVIGIALGWMRFYYNRKLSAEKSKLQQLSQGQQQPQNHDGYPQEYKHQTNNLNWDGKAPGPQGGELYMELKCDGPFTPWSSTDQLPRHVAAESTSSQKSGGSNDSPSITGLPLSQPRKQYSRSQSSFMAMRKWLTPPPRSKSFSTTSTISNTISSGVNDLNSSSSKRKVGNGETLSTKWFTSDMIEGTSSYNSTSTLAGDSYSAASTPVFSTLTSAAPPMSVITIPSYFSRPNTAGSAADYGFFLLSDRQDEYHDTQAEERHAYAQSTTIPPSRPSTRSYPEMDPEMIPPTMPNSPHVNVPPIEIQSWSLSASASISVPVPVDDQKPKEDEDQITK
ncbi:hypothetical protein BX616_007176, partial [Lobosporangium transversale]